MTSSPSLAHDQPIPFDNAPDQRNDPFNFASVPSTHPTAPQASHTINDSTQDVSSLFGNTGDSTFFNQPPQDYSLQASMEQHQSMSASQVPQQQSTAQNLYQQQQYQPLGSDAQPQSYDQGSHHEQQYVPTEAQPQSYQPEQWQQFDPNVHYYYDEQGQYHYYDPNTGQEYDYSQYTYDNAYDPQQYYTDDQQQYTTTTTSLNDLGNKVLTDLSDEVGYGSPGVIDTGYGANTLPQQQQHQAQETGQSNIHSADFEPTNTPGMGTQPLAQEQHAENRSNNVPGLDGQMDTLNTITAQKRQNSLTPLRQMTPQPDVLPQPTLVNQKWDQVDMDGQTDVVLTSHTNDGSSTLLADPPSTRDIDALGDDLDDLILGGGTTSNVKVVSSAPPPATPYTPGIYNKPSSRSATPQLPIDTTITCVNPSCQAMNKPASKFCEECGTPFVGNGSRAPTPAISTPYQPTAVQDKPAPISYQPTPAQESSLPTSYQPVSGQESKGPTTYDPSVYNRAYSPAIQENRYSPVAATPTYESHQPQHGDFNQQNSTLQYSQPSLYNAHTATPTYSEPQQYISRSATPVYNPLTSNQGQDLSAYSASPSHPVYPSATTATSVYDPSYYSNTNMTPASLIGNQQRYPSDTYSAPAVVPSATAVQQPPVDQDPLQRFNGCPLVQFGFGGKLCVMFPRSMSQYGGGYGSNPSVKKTPGAIQIESMENIVNSGDSYDDNSTLNARLKGFVGPLLQDPDFSVKNKKKQVLAYMDQRIMEMENVPSATTGLSDAQDRILLWKLVKLMIEQDGNIGESESTNRNVLDLLQSPTKSTTQDMNSFSVPAYDRFNQSQQTTQGSDDSGTVLDKLQGYLVQGDRRGAVNYAIQEDLWSHALIISSCVDRNMWQSVVRGFTQRDLAATSDRKQERVQHHIEGNRPGLRVLYALFSGLGASALSEFFVTDKRLSHVGNDRAQTPDGSMARAHPSLPVTELCKWKEILGLILANRTAKDYEAITALGDIMKNHGWINAAHICYLLSPQSSPHSGLDTPYVRYTLVGTNSLLEILKDVDSYILTELVEFALSLRPVPNGGGSCLPFLQGYKLVHAWWLADLGLVKDASRYCAAINQCIKTHSKESPYLHQHLLAKVKELTEICNEYHGKKGLGMDVTSWLKPSFKKNTLDSFWGSIEGKFNKFVSGDDTQMEESSGRKSTEIKTTAFETNIEPPARSASAVDFRMQQPSQMSSYLSFKRFK